MLNTATVTIACKLPHGLVLENTTPSGEKVTQRVNGARLRTTESGREINSHEVTGDYGQGYGLTFGVPVDFWEQWVAQNTHYPPFAKGHIFAQGDAANARAQAKEMAGVRTGLEPMPGKDDKLPDGLVAIDPSKER